MRGHCSLRSRSLESTALALPQHAVHVPSLGVPTVQPVPWALLPLVWLLPLLPLLLLLFEVSYVALEADTRPMRPARMPARSGACSRALWQLQQLQ